MVPSGLLAYLRVHGHAATAARHGVLNSAAGLLDEEVWAPWPASNGASPPVVG
jgi:hypothetical protein